MKRLLIRNRYHGKCLKIARGRVKEDEGYTCPICDWRVKIPRDASRPKLEDLIDWQAEIKNLPFQPEEEELLSRIIDNGIDFRNHIAYFCNNPFMTADECETQRFYLRKLEGAEILLVHETNWLRKQLHKWCPVADQPPPTIEGSKSTRKPRPTKLQKLMAMHGVDDPEALPAHLKTKTHKFARRSEDGGGSQGKENQPSGGANRPAQQHTPGSQHQSPSFATSQQAQRKSTGGPQFVTNDPIRGLAGMAPEDGWNGPFFENVRDVASISSWEHNGHPQVVDPYGRYVRDEPTLPPGGGYYNPTQERAAQPFTPQAYLNGPTVTGAPAFGERGMYSPGGDPTLGALRNGRSDSFGSRGAAAPAERMQSLFKDLTNVNTDDERSDRAPRTGMVNGTGNVAKSLDGPERQRSVEGVNVNGEGDNWRKGAKPSGMEWLEDISDDEVRVGA
jgi:hypothetical protein